jgi:hypothetical protein
VLQHMGVQPDPAKQRLRKLKRRVRTKDKKVRPLDRTFALLHQLVVLFVLCDAPTSEKTCTQEQQSITLRSRVTEWGD